MIILVNWLSVNTVGLYYYFLENMWPLMEVGRSDLYFIQFSPLLQTNILQFMIPCTINYSTAHNYYEVISTIQLHRPLQHISKQ